METEKNERRRREDSGACRHENRNGFVDTLLQIVRVVMLFVRANALSSTSRAATTNTWRCFAARNLSPELSASLALQLRNTEIYADQHLRSICAPSSLLRTG